MLGTLRTGPIGLDFGTEALKIVQADFTKSGPCVRSAVSIDYPIAKDELYASSAELKKLLREARKQGAFKGRRAVVAMPPEKVQFISLEYKHTPGQDVDEVVIGAIKERFGDSINKSVIDYLHIRPEHKDQVDRTALVAVAEQKSVIEFLDYLSKAGLNVVRLEIGPVAINRLISAMHPTQNDKVVLAINFGIDRSYATVLWGRRLLLDRSLSFGLNSALKQVSDALEVSQDEAENLLERHGVQVVNNILAGDDLFEPGITASLTDILKPSLLEFSSEIKRLMLYVASRTRGRNVYQAYIFGSVAAWPSFDKLLAEMTGLPVKTTRPFYGLNTSHQAEEVNEQSGHLGIAVATGLSLSGSETSA